ncbi:GDP-fucose transporter 1-like isoform X2 [Tubulanus polymorphus]|uniref:GDP-fucose transporter 1-like isoform X2 n=1 Tax=Tubulanus polymorphus TaxID=672921 RepID=UPI003DA66839
MMSGKEETFLTKTIQIGIVVASYWFVSISLVFVNKYLLSSKDLKLDAPFFITWYQCVITVALCAVIGTISKLFPKLISFPPFRIDPKICREILPLSIVFVCMITFNNLCLKYVGVAFYYVGRSLTTVFNVILSYLILKAPTSYKAMMCCGIIVGGFFLGVDQEGVTGSLSLIGVFYGIMASTCVALNSIYTKKKLPIVEENVWVLALYNNVNACVLFMPLMYISGEISVVLAFPKIANPTFWGLMTLGGVFGFAIGYVTGLQIKVTSPLTHTISGTAKACAQTIIACIYFHDVKPFLWWGSNAVVLAGSFAYTLVKRGEMRQKHDKDLLALQQRRDEQDEQAEADTLLNVKLK